MAKQEQVREREVQDRVECLVGEERGGSDRHRRNLQVEGLRIKSAEWIVRIGKAPAHQRFGAGPAATSTAVFVAGNLMGSNRNRSQADSRHPAVLGLSPRVRRKRRAP